MPSFSEEEINQCIARVYYEAAKTIFSGLCGDSLVFDKQMPQTYHVRKSRMSSRAWWRLFDDIIYERNDHRAVKVIYTFMDKHTAVDDLGKVVIRHG